MLSTNRNRNQIRNPHILTSDPSQLHACVPLPHLCESGGPEGVQLFPLAPFPVLAEADSPQYGVAAQADPGRFANTTTISHTLNDPKGVGEYAALRNATLCYALPWSTRSCYIVQFYAMLL